MRYVSRSGMISRRIRASMNGLPCSGMTYGRCNSRRTSRPCGRRPPSLVHDPLRPGADRHRAGHPARSLLSQDRDPDEAARRRLHRADQDDDRAGDLLHRRPRHIVDERSQEDRPYRVEDAHLFRGRLDRRTGDRPSGRRPPPSRRRLQYRSLDPRSEGGGELHDPRQGGQPGRPSPGDHSAGTPISAPSPAAICSRFC